MSEAGFARQRIRHGRRESLADIEVARRVILPVIERRAVRSTALSGLLIESMSQREADRGRQSVRGALRQRHLRSVVIGVQRIRHGVDVRVVGKFVVKRPRKLERSRIRVGRCRDRRWTRRAGARCRDCRDLRCREAHAVTGAYWRRIGVIQRQQLCRVIADISEVQ